MKEALRYAAKYEVSYLFSLLALGRVDFDSDLCLSLFQKSAVSSAMNIRAAAHFSRTRLHASGANSLELPYFEQNEVRLRGLVPIPAVLDYQIDYLCIRYMLAQMRDTADRLNEIIFPRSKKDQASGARAEHSAWYEVYLTCFVLLCSLESVHQRQIEMVKRWASHVSRLVQTSSAPDTFAC